MRSLTKDQLRRLKECMSDPIDGNHQPMTIRRAYAPALVEMIERREETMIGFVSEIETMVQSGDTDGALRRCREFWLSDDKWGDLRS